MGIKIIDEPDVRVTTGELARYHADYKRFMSYYCGAQITLGEYIRSRRWQKNYCRIDHLRQMSDGTYGWVTIPPPVDMQHVPGPVQKWDENESGDD